jgi:cellulose synthase/poly-beta-1,6-N-acetylglucosamine synthase-like glycosyltransferase/peptidoglycan/xylan/chitin deacetylase (PgdA/CDA1 family)/spore germination protein YaaH
VLGVFLLSVFIVTIIGVIIRPIFPEPQITEPRSFFRATPDVPKSYQAQAAVPLAMEDTYQKLASAKSASPSQNPASKMMAFYVNWDDNSLRSLKENIDFVDVLIPEWLHLGPEPGTYSLDNEIRQKETLELIRKQKPDMEIIPLINNFDPKTKSWDQEKIVSLLGNSAERTQIIGDLIRFISENNFQGINIDFENIPDAQQSNLVFFMKELSDAARPLGMKISQDIPLDDDSFLVKSLSAYSDFLVLMAYDEYALGNSPAGPIASRIWYDRGIAKSFSELPSEKYVIAIGNYGYEWEDQKTDGRGLTFQEAMRTANLSGSKIALDPETKNTAFSYFDNLNIRRTVWFLDAVSAFNEILSAKKIGSPHGFALWRLGSEDPSVWNVFRERDQLGLETLKKMQILDYGYDVMYEGEGEILKVIEAPKTGKRQLTYDIDTGFILKSAITEIPHSYVISRWGAQAEGEKKVALTFDDGPDPKFTPQILDILKDKGVSATFFTVGLNTNLNPDLVQRAYNEGHEIGNHTYTHPNIQKISSQQLRLELDANERLIEGVIQRKSLLFRPPYSEDIEPESPSEVRPLEYTSRLGFYTASMHIDPRDWNSPGTNAIVDRTVNAVVSGAGNIVLLHDGGGNRNQTVAALPQIIDNLKSQGYAFTTVSGLANLPRDEFMPPVEKNEQILVGASGVGFYALKILQETVIILFFAGIIFGSIRLVFVSILAIVQSIYSRKAPYKKMAAVYNPTVSVVVPAYNEENVIVKSIEALLVSTYRNFDIIVVDDGSNDDTYFILKNNFSGSEKIKIFTKANGGKASALNFGISKTKAEIIVALDADTLFLPDTMKKIICGFVNKEVAAIAGNAKVGNRINLLTKTQALEYITSQNLDRRAFEMMNCILVVPGSVGAWRRSAILEAGGFSDATLAEDSDMTLTLIKRGYQVLYECEALAYTEAPDSVGPFLRQRFRWMYGTFQSLWKHREVYLRKKYGALGMFGLPNILIFQILFPLFSPIMDIALVFSFIWMSWRYFYQQANLSMMHDIRHILFYYLLFLAIDMLASVIPFILERKEKWRLLPLVPLQRFFYRQLIYIAAIKAVFMALKGKIVGWGKLVRKATAVTD